MTAIVVPHRHSITAEEYLRMGEVGVFHPEARLELIEGEIFDLPFVSSQHAGTVIILNSLFQSLVRGLSTVSVQNPVVAGPHSVPQPDVALLKFKADYYKTAHPVASEVLLAVEVSDSTLTFDLNTKVPLYARSGIRELWVVDLYEARINVFRDPDMGTYRTSFVATGMDKLAVAALPDVQIELKELF
jgi:Uma2 family endonuclease